MKMTKSTSVSLLECKHITIASVKCDVVLWEELNYHPPPQFSRKEAIFLAAYSWKAHPAADAPSPPVDLLSTAFKDCPSSHVIFRLQPCHPAQPDCTERL